jgi:hypothetical protein
VGYLLTSPLRSTNITFEQQIQEHFRKFWIIINMLIELEVTIDHVLKQVIDNMIKSETRILGWIDAHTCFEGGIVRLLR